MKNIATNGIKKGTIVYVHGNSSSFRVFSEVLNSNKIQYTQIAVQLPGHEDFEQDTNTENFTIKKYVQSLKVFLATIDDDILLVGNSLGGHLAIEVAHHIKNLKGLVILAVPPVKKPINFAEAYLPNDLVTTFLSETPSNKDIIKAFRAIVFDQSLVSQMVFDFKQTNPKVRSCFAKDLEEQNFEDEEQLFLLLDLPKYIIIGDKDPSLNPIYLLNVCEKTKQNCSLLTLKDCGHYPSVDKPKEFIEIIRRISSEIFN